MQGSTSDASRFIPTPVGNTLLAAPPGTRPTVHPHARGEHPVEVQGQITCYGSSPRPWGTHYVQRDIRGNHRFIPTPVGNT